MTTRNLLACAISAAIATAACAADNGEILETIFIKTQRGYSADATETNRDPARNPAIHQHHHQPANQRPQRRNP